MKGKIKICTFYSFLIAASLFLIGGIFALRAEASQGDLITTQEDLAITLHEASAGAVLLVDDIQFTYDTTTRPIPTGLTIDRDVVIKSGKGEKAIFSAGSFAVSGSANPQDSIKVRFENISFEGVHNVKETNYEGSGIQPALSERYSAVFFDKCVEVEFDGCDFSNYYTLSYGGAIQGVYSTETSMAHRLSLSFTNCTLNENVGPTGGGAIYLSGKDNIYLTMKDCQLNGNVSSCGGAIRAHETNVVLENCEIAENRYIPSASDVKGGGIFAQNGNLNMKNCRITDNLAKKGGGIALDCNESVLDGCIISNNTAVEEGGAIWNENTGNNLVSVINSTISNNTAAQSGAIFSAEHEDSLGGNGKTLLYLCSVINNTPAMPINDGGRLSFWGSAFYGEDRGEQSPQLENGYCIFSQTINECDPYHHWHTEEHISAEMLKGANSRFANAYGEFYVGDNAVDSTYKFFSGEVCEKSYLAKAGEIPQPPESVKTGYSLVGWAFEQGGEYDFATPLMIGAATESVNLYAIFTPNVYRVTFDYGDTEKTVYQTYDAEILLPEAEERHNYTFRGWYTQKDGGGEQLAEGAVFRSETNVTYYAFFEKDFPTLIVVASVGFALLAGGMVALIVVVYKRRRDAMAVAVVGELEGTKNAPDTSMLSPREKSVLAFLLEGKQRNEIAKTLFISENTVKKQISSIYQKLGVSSRNELFALFK